MLYVWRPHNIYYHLIHRQFMQLYYHNQYERHCVILLPSQQVWTRFMFICIPRNLHWPLRAHSLRYLWVAPHNALWDVVATSLATILYIRIICQLLSRHFHAGVDSFILMLTFICNRCLAKRVTLVRQPILQVRIKALHWAAIDVL